MAAVIRVARAAPSTVSPALRAPPDAEDEAEDDEVLRDVGAPEEPQALRARAPDSATAANEVVFTQLLPGRWHAARVRRVLPD
jgi:hypothetical protein